MWTARRAAILVVEDEPALLYLRKLQFERAGYCVYTAATPEQALDVFHRERVDVLLTDYVLPRMNGIALGSLMKNSRPGLLVALVSGMPDCPEAKGADLFLPKPMDTADLIAAIADRLRKAS